MKSRKNIIKYPSSDPIALLKMRAIQRGEKSLKSTRRYEIVSAYLHDQTEQRWEDLVRVVADEAYRTGIEQGIKMAQDIVERESRESPK